MQIWLIQTITLLVQNGYLPSVTSYLPLLASYSLLFTLYHLGRLPNTVELIYRSTLLMWKYTMWTSFYFILWLCLDIWSCISTIFGVWEDLCFPIVFPPHVISSSSSLSFPPGVCHYQPLVSVYISVFMFLLVWTLSCKASCVCLPPCPHRKVSLAAMSVFVFI